MGKRGSVLSQIQSFDAYAKTLDDFRVKTYYGAICMLFLAVSLIIASYDLTN
jgi:hypothetical protein